jgi:acylphosphatase
MQAVHMHVTGRVQGVGFRYMTKNLADQLKITGWVKNNFDGSVEIEAQGDELILKEFIEGVKASPSPSGRVNTLKTESIPTFEAKHFVVKY